MRCVRIFKKEIVRDMHIQGLLPALALLSWSSLFLILVNASFLMTSDIPPFLVFVVLVSAPIDIKEQININLVTQKENTWAYLKGGGGHETLMFTG